MTDIQRSNLAEVTEALRNRKASKRRSAAMKIRKLMLSNAGEQLIVALKTELRDTRTWSAQYQMIIALGIIGHTAALPFLLELSENDFEHTTVEFGIGDAVVRLTERGDDALGYVTNWLDRGRYPIATGGLQASSVRRFEILEPVAVRILKSVESAPFGDIGNSLRRAAAAAAVNWPLSVTTPFLEIWQRADWNLLRNAASDSLQGKHTTWSL